METIELFEDYHSGKLTAQEEQNFFQQLASDDNMRVEFKCFNSISQASARTASIAIPSAELTASIFSNIGIDSVFPTNHTPASSLSKNAVIAKSSLVSTLATTSVILAVLWFAGVFDKKISNAFDYSKNETKPTSSMQWISRNNVNPNIENINKASAEPLASEITTKLSTGSNENLKLPNLKDIRSEKPIFAAKSQMAPQVDESKLNSLLHKQNQTSKYQYIANTFDNDLSRFSIKVMNRTAFNIPKEEISPKSFSPLHNTSFSFGVRITENFSTSFDIEQGTYYCEYEGTDSEGNLYLYKQQPNLTTFSAVLSYKYPMFEFISPSLSLGGGLNKNGFVIISELGADIKVTDYIDFICALRMSNFNFQHQSNRFWTSKISLSYGLSFKL